MGDDDSLSCYDPLTSMIHDPNIIQISFIQTTRNRGGESTVCNLEIIKRPSLSICVSAFLSHQFLYSFLFLGFGHKGGRSPVEHRGNLYVHPSIRPSIHPSVLLGDGLGLSGAGPSLLGAGSNHSVAVSGLSWPLKGLIQPLRDPSLLWEALVNP